MYRFFHTILFAFIYFSIIYPVYSRDFLIIGIPEEPNRWIDKSGKAVGIDIDIIDYIMKKMGIKYKVSLINSSSRLESLEKNNITNCDMIFTYSKNKDREVYLIYPKESHIEFSWNFFYLKENEGKYKYDSIKDLKGLKIGITKGFSYTPEFWNAVDSGLFQADIVIQNSLQLPKLSKKRFDLVPLNTIATIYQLKKDGQLSQYSYLPKPLTNRAYYNVFVKSSDYPNMPEIIKQYDYILSEMKKDGTLENIYKKYGLNYNF